MKLLVVDDSLVVRNVVERAWVVESFVGSSGGASPRMVLRAADGVEAVDLFRAHRPEMVTMDLTMPNLDGLGAIRAIRSIEPEASILVISALNSHETAIQAIQLGACGFLTKPFTESEVHEALADLEEHAHGRRDR